MANEMFSKDLFLEMIRNEIEGRIEKAIDNEIESLAAIIEKELRDQVGVIACSILKHYSVERRDTEILIKVDNRFGEQNDPQD